MGNKGSKVEMQPLCKENVNTKKRMEKLETRMENLEKQVENKVSDEEIQKVDKRMNELDERIDRLVKNGKTQFKSIESQSQSIKSLESTINTLHNKQLVSDNTLDSHDAFMCYFKQLIYTQESNNTQGRALPEFSDD